MEIDNLKAEVLDLRRRVLMETIRRCSSEMQAAKASMAAIQMRIPQIEQEAQIAQAALMELTKEPSNGPSGN